MITDKAPSQQSINLINPTAFWLSLWDKETGGFRFTLDQPVTLMATAYCVLGLEFSQGLSQLADSQKERVIAFLVANAQTDGSFKEPLFAPEDILSEIHNTAYFQEETTTFCQQALDALGAPPPPPRIYSDGRDTPDGLIQFFESLSWEDAWLDSNPVMFALSQLCHDAERHDRPELLDAVDVALDWLDNHQSSKTGLWEGSHPVSLVNAMAATFHFTFFYLYRNRPIKHVERIIDSCLELQKSHGLFSQGAVIGQTCLDYDAIDLLAKAASSTDYRASDVRKAMARSHTTLLDLYNPQNGGFVDSKERVEPDRHVSAKVIRKLGLSKWKSTDVRIPSTGTYHVCWKLLSCERSHSNAFSTWLRLLSIYLSSWAGNSSQPMEKVMLRRLPFIGFHP